MHGNAKTDEEIELAVRRGVGLIVVDNFDDIDRLERIVPAGQVQPCLVRVIPGVRGEHPRGGRHRARRLEVRPDCPTDARVAIARIERSTVLRCDGVHTHVGSQLLNVEQLAAAVAPSPALGTFDVYDLGGGLGVRYTYDEHPPDLDDYADAMIGAGPRAAARPAPHHHRARPQHGRRDGLHGLPGDDRQARRRSPSSRSTAGWATTWRCRCTGSGSRPPSSTGSAAVRRSPWSDGTASRAIN